jgi:hypothetical protein
VDIVVITNQPIRLHNININACGDRWWQQLSQW